MTLFKFPPDPYRGIKTPPCGGSPLLCLLPRVLDMSMPLNIISFPWTPSTRVHYSKYINILHAFVIDNTMVRRGDGKVTFHHCPRNVPKRPNIKCTKTSGEWCRIFSREQKWAFSPSHNWTPLEPGGCLDQQAADMVKAKSERKGSANLSTCHDFFPMPP